MVLLNAISKFLCMCQVAKIFQNKSNCVCPPLPLSAERAGEWIPPQTNCYPFLKPGRARPLWDQVSGVEIPPLVISSLFQLSSPTRTEISILVSLIPARLQLRIKLSSRDDSGRPRHVLGLYLWGWQGAFRPPLGSDGVTLGRAECLLKKWPVLVVSDWMWQARPQGPFSVLFDIKGLKKVRS